MKLSEQYKLFKEILPDETKSTDSEPSDLYNYLTADEDDAVEDTGNSGEVPDLYDYLTTEIDVTGDDTAETDLPNTEEDFDEMSDLQNDESDLSINDDEDSENYSEDDGITTEDNEELDNEENSNLQGVIRTVKGANLVFKKQTPDGKFEELWIYNIGGDIKTEMNIRRGILSGTDILPNKESSDSGEQVSESWSIGNVQFIKISGLNS